MVRLICFLFVSCIAVSPQDAVARDAKLPSCDIKHIALELRFDWKNKQADGKATIRLSRSQPADHITLDSGNLSIQSVTDSDGKPLDFELSATDGDDNLRIGLGRIYKPNETITVAITYRTNHVNKADPNNIWGSFGKGLRFQQPTSTTPNKRPQIWSSGEPNGNRYWFPGNDEPGDLRTTEIKATVQQPFDVISNGERMSVKSNADGTRTFHFKTTTPHPNHLTSIVVGEYTPMRQEWDGIELTTYGYADEKAAVKATVERLPEMIEFFSIRTGVRYPYARYSQVVVQDHPFPGRVGQHMVPIMSDNMIDDFRTHADFLYLWDSVEAQSLASQWFGNLIAPRDWKHLWLSHGFSRYFDGLFNIEANGSDEFLTYYVTNDMGSVMGAWKSNDRRPIVPGQIDDLETFTYDSYSRNRAALVLRMLQHELGEDTWSRVVRRYVKANAGKLVTTDNLQAAIRAETGDSLDWFFRQWIYGMGHPVFDVSQEFDAAAKQLKLTVRQTQQPDKGSKHPQVDFFQGRIRVAIDGRIKTVRLEPKAVNTFEFATPAKPRLVNFDHEDAWIKEVTFKKSLPELLYQLQHDKDVLGQRLAMQQLATRAQDDQCTKAAKDQIIAGLRDMIDGDSYWRIRASAATQLGNLLARKSAREPTVLDESVVEVLLKASRDEAAWLRRAAITLLGKTGDQRFVDNYIAALDDESDRVINAAATALGKTKGPRAFDVLVKLKDKPSWKSQSLISTLNGLRELGDPRGYDVALAALSNKRLPRWWLASPTWDYPIPAVQTIVALGKGETVFPLLFDRFNESLADDDYNDIFSNVLLITELGDPRGAEVFETLKKRFAKDSNAMTAIGQFESRFQSRLKTNNKTGEVEPMKLDRTLAQSTDITKEWQSEEARQFDFWIGEWDVNLRAIQEDLSWKDTTKAKVKVYPVLDGKAILELWDSPTIKGFSLRYYDARKGKWVLWLNWPNENKSHFVSLEGEFRHGRGEFFSKDKGVISRFTFCDISPTSLRWDDAYSKDGGKTWTYDWVMEFSRSAPTADWPTISPTAHTFDKPGTRCQGNETEFDHIASIAGHWTGSVELTAGKQQTTTTATARAYRILDGCAAIQFVEFEHDGKPFRLFSMLIYNSIKKRFEELRLDNQKDSPARVLHGQLADGRLTMKPEGGSSSLQTQWNFPRADGDLQVESQDETGTTQLKTKLTIKRKPPEQISAGNPRIELKLPDAINTTCPRSGKPVVANSLATYRGVTVGFCNQHCRDDFAANIDDRPDDRKFFDKILAKRK